MGGPVVLTPDQVAERMQIPRRTVVALCAQQRLPGARKAGRCWRIPDYAIDRYMRTLHERSSKFARAYPSLQHLDLPDLPRDPVERRREIMRSRAFVYFVQAAPGGLIKIGTAIDLDDRLYTLRRMSPVPLDLLASGGGGRNREAELHRRFRHLREHGEWFRPGDELLTFVAGLAAS